MTTDPDATTPADDLERVAREAFEKLDELVHWLHPVEKRTVIKVLLDFAKSVAAGEREAGRREGLEEAAKIADTPFVGDVNQVTAANFAVRHVAAAIRERLASLDRRAAGGADNVKDN